MEIWWWSYAGATVALRHILVLGLHDVCMVFDERVVEEAEPPRLPCRFAPRQSRKGCCHVTDSILSPLHLELESEVDEARRSSGEVAVKNGYRISRRPPRSVSQSNTRPGPFAGRLVPSRLISFGATRSPERRRTAWVGWHSSTF